MALLMSGALLVSAMMVYKGADERHCIGSAGRVYTSETEEEAE